MYGLGWRTEEINGIKRIGHGGNLNGFKSFYGRFVNEGSTIIVMTNLDQVDFKRCPLHFGPGQDRMMRGRYSE